MTPELIQVQEPKSRDERKVSLLTLCGLALVIGVMTGLGAVAFRALIGFVHNAFYNGKLSFIYDANVAEAPSRFGKARTTVVLAKKMVSPNSCLMPHGVQVALLFTSLTRFYSNSSPVILNSTKMSLAHSMF